MVVRDGWRRYWVRCASRWMALRAVLLRDLLDGDPYLVTQVAASIDHPIGPLPQSHLLPILVGLIYVLRRGGERRREERNKEETRGEERQERRRVVKISPGMRRN